MRKAVITGLVTGIIISLILIGGTYLRRFLPDTFTANLLFLILFFGSIVTTVWLSLHLYCRRSVVKWMTLSVTGIISSIIAALLVSIHGYMYSRFTDPTYLDEIMLLSKQKWQKTNDAAESFIGSWTWFQSPADLAWYNFRDLILLLFLISITITVVFYLLNRNRNPGQDQNENHELIF